MRLKSRIMTIKPNDHKYTDEENRILEKIRKDIIFQLEKSSSATIYAYGRCDAESYDRIIGKEFKQAGYYVAYDYVPRYRSMIVSKRPIGQPTGRLVSRDFE